MGTDRRRWRWLGLLSLLSLVFTTALSQSQTVDPWSVQRGGQLYDKWFKVVGAADPVANHPLWALQTTNTRKGPDTWRCKECHGWDYKGKDGAYSGGSHFTGFVGVWEGRNKSVVELMGILRGNTNPQHDFSKVLSSRDITDLANFIKYGLLDMSKLVDYKAKKPLQADLTSGRAVFGICAACHLEDGKGINFGTPEKPVYIGFISKDNPFETLHKIWAGQPGTRMPGMYGVLTQQQMMDLLAYSQSLPEE